MAYLYAMSDIHGALDIFKEMLTLVDLKPKENKLILLGDYIDRNKRCLEPLLFIKNLQEQYGEQVMVLAGNHEFMLLEDVANKSTAIEDAALLKWLKGLPYYYETDTQVFVHAGIDEEAGEYWKWGSEDYYFCCKYPHTVGKFDKDIIAGHIGTDTIAGVRGYHRVFWDKRSHYYIDGTTECSGLIPLLQYDTLSKKYASFEKIVAPNGQDGWRAYIIK